VEALLPADGSPSPVAAVPLDAVPLFDEVLGRGELAVDGADVDVSDLIAMPLDVAVVVVVTEGVVGGAIGAVGVTVMVAVVEGDRSGSAVAVGEDVVDGVAVAVPVVVDERESELDIDGGGEDGCALGVSVAVAVSLLVGVMLDVRVGVAVMDGDAPCVNEDVGVAESVLVADGVADEVAVAVRVVVEEGVLVPLPVPDSVGVCVGVPVPAHQCSDLWTPRSPAFLPQALTSWCASSGTSARPRPTASAGGRWCRRLCDRRRARLGGCGGDGHGLRGRGRPRL